MEDGCEGQGPTRTVEPRSSSSSSSSFDPWTIQPIVSHYPEYAILAMI